MAVVLGLLNRSALTTPQVVLQSVDRCQLSLVMGFYWVERHLGIHELLDDR